jgi:hypothetical protein
MASRTFGILDEARGRRGDVAWIEVLDIERGTAQNIIRYSLNKPTRALFAAGVEPWKFALSSRKAKGDGLLH